MGVHIMEKQESYVVMKNKTGGSSVHHKHIWFKSHHIWFKSHNSLSKEGCICVLLDPPHISLLLHPYNSCINL